MINIYPLFSGSKGNAILVSDNDTSILFDCGISLRRLERAMKICDTNPAKASALFVTHEHSDHIRGCTAFVKKYAVGLYSAQKTLDAIESDLIVDAFKTPITATEEINIGTLCVTPFVTSHDAVSPMGYKISDGRMSVAIATDTGVVTDDMRRALKGCSKVMLEANHDVDMLLTGRYPAFLKKRILSEKGHLSNVDSASFCCELAESGCEKILLAHLSEENNTPEMAYGTVCSVLRQNGINPEHDLVLKVAKASMTGV